MADLQMLSYKLEDLQFFNKLDKAGQVQLENNSNFTVKYNADSTKCVAKLYQCVKDKTDNPDHRFFASVELVGLFQVTGEVTDDDKKEFHVRCYEQLFWYADTVVSRLCEAGYAQLPPAAPSHDQGLCAGQAAQPEQVIP